MTAMAPGSDDVTEAARLIAAARQAEDAYRPPGVTRPPPAEFCCPQRGQSPSLLPTARQYHSRDDISFHSEPRPMTASTLTIPETAQRWKVSARTVRRMIQRGELPTFRVGRQIRVSPDAVARVESPAQARKV